MALTKLQFRPGINKESTTYANEGGWNACDKVRFRSGFPAKIGGWINQNFDYTYSGVARNLWNWVTFDSQNLLGVGTNQKYYVENGGEFHDITPVRTTLALGSNPVSTVNGQKQITIAATAHGATVGSFVTLVNAGGSVSVGGVLIASATGIEWEIVDVPDSNSFLIASSTAATSTATGGGAALQAEFQINAGNAVAVAFGAGWGAGSWPSYTVVNLTNPFTASATGISTLTVTHVTPHGLTTGEYVFFASIASNPCGIDRAVLLKAFPVTVTSPTTYTISTDIGGLIYTTGSTAASGGAVTVYLPAAPLRGWGTAASTATASYLPIRLWSHDNYLEDLILNPRGEPIYYWVKDTSSYARAVPLSTIATQQVKTSAVAAASTTTTTLIVNTSFLINPGAIIIGTNIPTGTTVVSVVGTTLTLSAAPTGGGILLGDNLDFTYSGTFVPRRTNFVIASDTNNFTIALGSNPYDPTNALTEFNPMLVRWSDQDRPWEWVPETTNQSGEQPLSNGSYLVCAKDTRQEILVWSDAALFSMQYLGPPYVWGFNLLMDNISIISPNAAITVNSVTYWMGVDKFYAYSGRVETLPCSLRQFVYTNINRAQIQQVVCGSNEGYNEIWWFYPTGNSTVNDSYVVYNHLERIWYYGTLQRTAWLDTPLRQYPLGGFSVQVSYLDQNLSDSATTITLLNGTAYPASGTVVIEGEEISYTGVTGNSLTGCTRGTNNTTAAAHLAYTPVFFKVPNQIMQHENGVDDQSLPVAQPIYSYIGSSDFDIGDGMNYGFVWRVLPDVTFTGTVVQTPLPYVLMTIDARQNSGTAYSAGITNAPDGAPEITLTSASTAVVEIYTGEVFTRIRGRQMSFKIESTELGVNWQLGTPRIDIRPDGRR